MQNTTDQVIDIHYFAAAASAILQQQSCPICKKSARVWDIAPDFTNYMITCKVCSPEKNTFSVFGDVVMGSLYYNASTRDAALEALKHFNLQSNEVPMLVFDELVPNKIQVIPYNR